MHDRIPVWLIAVVAGAVFQLDSANYLSWLIMAFVTTAAVAFYVVTAWRNRNVPKTRAEMQDHLIIQLRGDLADRDRQVEILLNNMVRDRSQLWTLEQENAVLQHQCGEQKVTPAMLTQARAAANPEPWRKLSTDQLRLLRDELLGCYTTLDDWRELLQDAEHPLDIAIGDNLTIIAGKVLEQAQKAGWLELLIVTAARNRPDVRRLQVLTITLLDALGT